MYLKACTSKTIAIGSGCTSGGSNEEMKNATKEVHEYIDESTDDGVVGTNVSFDGTWAKRGIISLTCAGFFLFSPLTPEKFWTTTVNQNPARNVHSINRSVDSAKLQQWLVQHIPSKECDIKFDGSSPAMECEGAVVLQR